MVKIKKDPRHTAHFPWIGTSELHRNCLYLRKPVQEKTGLQSGDTALIIIVGSMEDPWEAITNFTRLTTGQYSFKMIKEDVAKEWLLQMHDFFMSKEFQEIIDEADIDKIIGRRTKKK